MGMIQARTSSDQLEESNISPIGFNRAIKRIGMKLLAEGTRQHPVAHVTEDMVATFAKLAYVPSETSDIHVPASKLGPRKRKQIKIEVTNPPSTDESVEEKVIQPAKKTQPKGVSQPVSTRSERNAAANAAKKLRKEKTKAKIAKAEQAKADAKAKAKADSDAEVPHIPEIKVVETAPPAKAKAKAPAVKTKKAKAKAKAVKPAPVVAKAKPVEKAKPVAVVKPPKVQRENVSTPPVSTDVPMITKTLASGKVVSKPDNSGPAIARVTPQGESRGQVQYVSNTISVGKVATYDHYETFLGMKTQYMTRLVEQAYVDWLESRPNNHTYTVRGRDQKTVRLEFRTQVEIAGVTILLSGKSRKYVKVPVNYDHSAAEKKTYHSERSRSDNVVSIDSKRKQSVAPTGEATPPVVIPSSSKERILGKILGRKSLERQAKIRARLASEAARKLALIRPTTEKQASLLSHYRSVVMMMSLKPGQVVQKDDSPPWDIPSHPAVHCTCDNLYESRRLQQDPGCAAPIGDVSVAEQIRRMEALPDVVNNDDYDSPVDLNMVYEAKAEQHMWYRKQAELQHVRQHRGFLEELQVEQSLKRLEAKCPSHVLHDEVARLDRWYANRCWADPKLDEARQNTIAFLHLEKLRDSGADVPQSELPEIRRMQASLLRIERGWQDMAHIEPWVWSPEIDTCSRLYNRAYGSPIDMDTVHEEALIYQADYRARFDARKEKVISISKANKERGKQKGSSGVIDSAVVTKPASTLTDPKPVSPTIDGGVIPLLKSYEKTFTALNTVLSPKNAAVVFKGIMPNKQHGGGAGYFPLLE